MREVWIWQRATSEIAVHVLVDGAYERRDVSLVLPGLDPRRLHPFLDLEPQSRALRAFRAWLGTSARDA